MLCAGEVWRKFGASLSIRAVLMQPSCQGHLLFIIVDAGSALGWKCSSTLFNQCGCLSTIVRDKTSVFMQCSVPVLLVCCHSTN